ncbi:MAG: class I SAM-dependent methyltransferase [Candidatus Dormiibacterota bacterium]
MSEGPEGSEDPRRVRDDAEEPDPGFAELYAALPDAVDLEPWRTFCASADGPVLYLGIGAGRLAIPLLREGIPLVGVDAHPGMLRRLRERAPSLELHRARIESLRLGRRFSRVIAPSNILCTGARLRGAARQLTPDGELAFELMNPHWVRAGPPLGVCIRYWNREATPEEVSLEIEYETGHVQEAVVPLWWPEQIGAYCAAAGLELRRLGPTDPEDPLEEAPTFLVVAARRARPQC